MASSTLPFLIPAVVTVLSSLTKSAAFLCTVSSISILSLRLPALLNLKNFSDMCTSPLCLRFEHGVTTICHRLKRYYNDYDHRFEFRDDAKSCNHATYRLVPCGKCCECLQAKHNALAVRLYRECLRSSSVYFSTYTYNNDNFPVAVCSETGFNELTGEVELTPPVVVSGHSADLLREDFSSFKTLPDFISLPYGGEGFRMFVAPSLDRSHFRDALKVVRERFYREYGYRAEFKYYLVGEYGSRTHRPHYHCLWFNCPASFVALFHDFWVKAYGFALDKKVEPNARNNVAQGYLATSRYISKYVSKGMFDEDRPAFRLTQAPRVCSSRYIGLSKDFDVYDDISVRSWLRLSDFTDVDWNSYGYPRASETIFPALRERLKHFLSTDGEHYYKCPPLFVKRLFSKYDKNLKKYVKLPLFIAYQDWLARVVSSELTEQLPQAYSLSDEASIIAVQRFEAASSNSRESRALRAYQNLKKAYSKSVF